VLPRHCLAPIIGGLVFVFSSQVCRAQTGYVQTNLVSSVPGLAPVTDPLLTNPWGLAFPPTGPFWIANQISSRATVYNGSGQPFPVGNPLVVTVASNAGAGPTGQVFNPTTDFQISPGVPATFIFANLDGSISGWNGALGNNTLLAVSPSPANVYTGLARGNNGSGNFLYAANHATGNIDVFNATFGSGGLGGTFTDPNLPAGFTPHNVQNLGGTVYVAYENPNTSAGIVDAFDQNGNIIRRVTASALLNSPWGLALAPAGFGQLAGALLVGNEGNGQINGFDPITGQFRGQVVDSMGNPIVNEGLWALTFGNGGLGGDPNTLYFTAGIRAEQQGLFGAISAVPEPALVVLLGAAGLTAVCVSSRKRNARQSHKSARSKPNV
jgi:uncharacterized protein (TIGR03118 family)